MPKRPSILPSVYTDALERLTHSEVLPQRSKEVKPQKVTFYLSADKVVALEEVKVKILKATGVKRSRSQLVEEAIDLFLLNRLTA